MTEDKSYMNRRDFIKNTAKGAAGLVAAAAALESSGAEAPRADDDAQVTVSEGQYLEVREIDTVEVKEVYENGEADLELVTGPEVGNFSDGEGVICDQTGKDHVGAYVDEVNPEENTVEFRLDYDSNC